jgi:predicted phosphodiesterase
MPLTVLAVADEVSPVLYDHFDARRWKDVDLVISCGDLSPDYLDFLGTRLSVPVFYVRGNHDGAYPRSEYEVGQDLHGRIVEYRGLKLAGFEGCRRYNHGFCQYTEGEMRRIVRRSRLRTLGRSSPDIVVTHAPPAGYHDGADPCHKGFDCFTRIIETWKPAYLLHGHTHAYDRKQAVTIVNGTTVVNVYPYYVFEAPEPVPVLANSPSPAGEVAVTPIRRQTHA